MKRKILSLAIVAISALTTISATAAPRHHSKDRRPDAPCCVDSTKTRPDSLKARGMAQFEGLDLTDAQRQQLQGLFSARPDKRVAPDKTRRDRVKADSITPEKKREMKAERRRAALEGRQQFLLKVKDILSPEQYVKFLENNYVKKDLKVTSKTDRRGPDKAPGTDRRPAPRRDKK